MRGSARSISRSSCPCRCRVRRRLGRGEPRDVLAAPRRGGVIGWWCAGLVVGHSVHHDGIVVVLELQQVVGRIPEDERVVSFGLTLKAAEWVDEKWQVVRPGQVE